MSNGSIHLRGQTNEIEVPIHGKTVIEKGEDVFIAQDAVCIVGSAADHYGYPASNLAAVTDSYHTQNYAGIAMKGSISGVTENIPVATSGIFRRKIKLGTSATSQTCKIGQTVAACTIGASGVSISGTTVSVGTGGDHDAGRIGRVVKAEYQAKTVDFMLFTRLSGASIVAS